MHFRRAFASVVSVVLLSVATPAFAAPAKKEAPASVAKAELPPEAAKLIDEAIVKGQAQKFPDAIDLLTQALAILEKKLGKDHYLLGNTLNLLAQIETVQRNFDVAEKHAERSIAILKKDVNADPLRLGHALIRRAELYRERGKRDEEIELRRLTIGLFGKAFGPEGIDAMAEILGLARAYQYWGMYPEAKAQYEQWIAVIEKRFGASEPVLIDILVEEALGEVLAGHLTEAQALYDRAQKIATKNGITGDKELAGLLTGQAEIHYQRGEYVQAEALYARVVAVYEQNKNTRRDTLAIVLGNLGAVRLDLGRIDDGLLYLRKALEVQEAHFGTNDPILTTALNNLGEAYLRIDRLDEAIPYLERALVLREKELGPEHPKLVTPLVNLGAARLDTGKIADAEKFFRRAQAIQEKTVGPDHPLMFQIHQAMGILEQRRNNWAQAEERHNKAVVVLEKAFGKMHPDIVAPLKSLAVILTRRKDLDGARKTLERAGDIGEKHTSLLMAVGTENQKIAWLETTAPLWSMVVEHHLRREPTNPAAARMALEFTWRRKGRALDAVTSNMAYARRLSGEKKAAFDKLRASQQALANISVRGIPAGEDPSKWVVQVERLTKEIEEQQDFVNTQIPEQKLASTPATVAAMQAMLTKDAAYVEIIKHSLGWLNLPGEQSRAQYTAYILRSEGEPKAVALGDVAEINAAVAHLREALAEPARNDVQSLSKALEALVMRPLREHLSGIRQLIIAPDGALNFIPFEALMDEQGHYWIENLSISYVTSGRDVFRWPLKSPSRSGPMIVANPDFGAIQRSPTKSGNERSVDRIGVSRLGFLPLPGTAQEGEAIAKQFRGAALHTEKKANKSVLMSVAGPKVLHIATHGFFLDESALEEVEGTRGFTIEAETPPSEERAGTQPPPPRVSPMLRSGMALSGANERGQTRGDGILTAFEASGLDLDGTKLVVLSACETGLGKMTQSDGVMGLRRAFVLAGAETTVMSLWKVDDEATRDMMIGYYRRLEAGGGRSESLREVRLQMMHAKATSHPFYWASFIVSGNPTRLDGTAVTVPAVAPSARGCACITAGDVASSNVPGAWILFVMVGGAKLVRRRRLS